jgi:peptide/nickel transport system permease protein
MFAYILRRSLVVIFVIFIVVSGSFFLIRMMPGNPMQVLYQQLVKQGGLSPQQIDQQIKVYYGVQQHGALWDQYVQYMWHAAQGNFGRSITDPTHTVAQIIKQALPWTIFIVASALLVSFVLGTAVGTIMAVAGERALGKVLTTVTTLFSAIPSYVTALLLIWQLAAIHSLFPIQGNYASGVTPGYNLAFLGSVLYHAILPIIASTIGAFGGWALWMKGSTVSTLGADYIRAGESWGLTKRRINQTYIGRNSMLPLVTNLALSLGTMFGGGLFIETFFTYPGIAYYMVQAIGNRDYPLMMGCFIVLTTATVVANFVIDLLYPFIDPRIARVGGQARKAAARRRAVAGAAVGTGAAA